MESRKFPIRSAIEAVLLEFQRCGVPVAPRGAVVAATMEGMRALGDEVFEKFEVGPNSLSSEVDSMVSSGVFTNCGADFRFLGKSGSESSVALGDFGTQLALGLPKRLPGELAVFFLEPSQRIAVGILRRKNEFNRETCELQSSLVQKYKRISDASPLWEGAGE